MSPEDANTATSLSNGPSEPREKSPTPETWGGIAWKHSWEIVALLTTGFGAFELIPDYGVWAPTALAALILFYWFWTGGHDRARDAWKAGVSVLARIPVWWQPGLAVGILVIAWGLTLAGALHTAFGRKDFRFEGRPLRIEQKKLAEERFPAFPGDGSGDRRQREEIQFSIWKNWMASGVRGGQLYWLECETFTEDYADFTVTLQIGTDYIIQRVVAFLEEDAKRFEKDQSYRPRWRQMRTRLLKGSYAVDVELENPEKRETLTLFVHVCPKKSTQVVDIDKCFISDELEVR